MKNMLERRTLTFSQYEQPNKFPLNQILADLRRNGEIEYEYYSGQKWSDGPPSKKPEARRIIFDDDVAIERARQMYYLWSSLSWGFKERSIFPEKIVDRLIRAVRTDQPINFFVPWGIRYQGRFGKPEKDAFKEIKRRNESIWTISSRKILNTVEPSLISTQVTIMPADTYATEINGIKPDKVARYFADVSQFAQSLGFQVKSWSSIREENLDDYVRLWDDFSNERIDELVTPAVIDRAIKSAQRRTKTDDPRMAAYEYMRERLCEAEIIERTLKPVKVSMVDRVKDNILDGPLPRVYILPERLKFPWLK